MDAIVFPESEAVHTLLGNGLEIIVKEDRSAPVVSLQAWCRTGSIYEGEWLGGGISHLVEHMLFKGTERRAYDAIARDVQELGGYVNAYTSFDRTVYWIDAPSESMAGCLEVLADIVTGSTFPDVEFEKEKEVIRREFAMGADDPDRELSKLLFSTAFREHPYAYPVIGHRDVFDRIGRDDAFGYYRRHYAPNNMFYVVVGDVHAEEVVAELKGLYEGQHRRRVPPVYVPREPAPQGKREERKGFATRLSKVALAWHIPDLTHPDMPALDVLATVLGDGRSSRLYREIRDGRGLAHSVGAYSYTPAHGGLFVVSGETDPEKREALEAALHDVMGSVACDGVGEAEVAKAKKMTLSDQFQGLTTMRGQAGDLGSNWLLTRNLDFSRRYLKGVEAVTADAVREVARRYFVDDTLTVVSLDPKGEAPAVRPKHPVPPPPEIERVELPNGMVLLVRPDHRLPLVSIQCVFRGGLLAETAETAGVTQLLASAMPKGAAGRGAEEIADAIESVGGSLGGHSGNNSFSMAAEVMRQDVEMALGLVSDIVTKPEFSEAAVRRELEAQLAAVRERDEHPMSVATLAMKRALFGDLPYALPRTGTEESLGHLNPEALRAFHETYAVGGNGVIAVFGDVEVGRIRELAGAGFGGMERGVAAFSDVSRMVPRPGFATEVERRLDKEQGVVVIGYPAPDLKHPDRLALNLIDEALSDMASRLFVRIREELGLAYYVGAGQLIGLAPGAFYVYAGTAPEKVEAVRDELLAEMGRVGSEGLDAAELRQAKKTYVSKLKIQLQTNGALAQAAALDELYGLGLDYHLTMGARIEAVTDEDVTRVAREIFHERPYVVASVRPEVG